MKIIEIDLFVKAFEESGLKPMQGMIFPKDGCACALGAYAYVNGCKGEKEALNYVNSLTSTLYVNSFGFGFDGSELPLFLMYDNPEAKAAFKHGMDTWEAVKHLAN